MTSRTICTRPLVPFSQLTRIASRIARMSGDELRVRFSQYVAARWDSRFRIWKPGVASIEPIGEIQPIFFFSPRERDAIIGYIKRSHPEIVEDVSRAATDVCEHRFRLLGYQVHLGSCVDWHRDPISGIQSPRKPFYQIRYLDYSEVGDAKVTWELSRHQHLVLLARAYCYTGEERFVREVVTQWYDWWQNNPYLIGLNWASTLEVGFRAMSWAWVFQLIRPALPSNFARELEHSFLISATHIERYLSTYFSPNTHILGEALALFVLGSVLNGHKRAAGWRETGWNIMLREASRQIQEGGMHFEQSSYYHVYALDMFLHARILAEKCKLQIPPDYDGKIRQMLDVLYSLSGTGVTKRFGDDDGGRLFDGRRNLQQHMIDPLALGCAVFDSSEWKLRNAHVTEETVWLAGAEASSRFEAGASLTTKICSRTLGASGFHVLGDEISSGFFDAGGIGNQGAGHGHADALSFQLSVGDQEVLVDSGTFVYVDNGQERFKFRGTAAHSTALVDDMGQARSSGPFRWEGLPELKLERCEYGNTFDFIVASHNGYRRLSDPVTHRRSIFHSKSGLWFVLDRIECNADHNLAIHWHLHPGLSARVEDGTFIVRRGSEPCLALLAASSVALRGSIEQGWYSPVYGQRIRNQVLRFRCSTKGSTQIAFAMQVTLNAKAFAGSFAQLTVNSGLTHCYRLSSAEHDSMLLFGDGGVWSAQGISTDARLFYWGKEGSALVLIFCDATTLSIAGRQMIRSGSPVRRYECTLKDCDIAISGSDVSAVSPDLPHAMPEVERTIPSVVVGVS